MMRIATCILVVLAASACDRFSKDSAAERQQVDAGQLYSSAGEVQLTDGGSVEF